MKNFPVELLFLVISLLWMIATALLSFIVAIYNGRIKALEASREDHQSRIQTLEDVQTLKIDELSKKVSIMEVEIKHEFEQMKQQVGTLSQNLHKQKNEESALVLATNGLLKFLERHEKGSN
jgi:uncharacterized membrane protein YqhA